MEYTVSDIDKIMEFTSWDTKQKVNELLRIDCKMYTNLGSTSTKIERTQVKQTSKKIYKLIKTINVTMGSLFINALD